MGPSRSRARKSPRYAIGVDLGGSRLRVLALDPSGGARRWSGPAVDLHRLPARLACLWRGWRLHRGQVRALVVASRGVWTGKERRAQERRLRHLAGRVAVISDAEAAYRAALGDSPGILLVAGTGSIALGRGADGRWRRSGGLGPLLGDEGSAFWIGRQWLRRLAQRGDFSRDRRLLQGKDPVARIAALAPMVLRRARRGDRGARSVIVAAQSELGWLVLTLAQELRLPSPLPVSWAGGLLSDPRFRAGVWHALRRGGLAVVRRAPVEDPVDAAARMAASLL